MLKKQSIFAIFLGSAIVSLSPFNHEQSLAQSDYQRFLQNVYNRSANTCRQYRSQCARCAEDLARQIISQNRISNPRVQRDVYNAAVRACY